MKKVVSFLLILFLSCNFAWSQDTLYIYRAGIVVVKSALSEVDSITFSKNYNLPIQQTVADIDGNVYHTVKIGSQTWMVENLKTSRYRNGDIIGTTSSLNMDLTYETAPKYQWSYNGIESNVPTYGRLYTWYTVTDNRNIAPAGWHVATDAEWAIMQNFLISNGYNYDKTTTGNNIAKSICTTTLWNTCSIVGTAGCDLTTNNSSGLSMVPNGYRGFDGYFYLLGNGTDIWTETENSPTLACARGCGYNVPNLGANNLNKNYGFSVRCIKDTLTKPILTTIAPTQLTDSTAICGGNITSDGGSAITSRGICWSTSQNPTIDGSKTIDSNGIGSFTSKITSLKADSTYYVRAYATNTVGTTYGNQINFKAQVTVTDVDGNVYHTIKIGTQTWLVENLKTTKYRNGNLIGTTTSINTDLTYATNPKYQWAYNGIESNVQTYGRLYTWYVVTDSIGIAPIGWHIATDAEWTSLQNYLISNGFNYDNTTIDNKIAISLCSTSLWTSSSITGTPGFDLTKNNSSGFSLIPGGYRGFDGYYYLLGNGTDIWTSTESGSVNANARGCGYNAATLGTNSLNKNYGFSVRCIRDN